MSNKMPSLAGLLRRLSQTLPQTVDQLTPEGQLPRFRP